MAATVRVGSVGVAIIVPLTDTNGNPIDLRLATNMTLYLQAPNATTGLPKNATRVGDGKEGKMTYTTVAGDLPVAGDWHLQARVQYTNPVRDWWSDVYPLVVAANLGS